MSDAFARQSARDLFRAACVLSVVDWGASFAFYVSLTLYLTQVVGFGDVAAGWVVAVFGAAVCAAPPFAGAIADRIGFRRALAAGYAVAAAGYGVLAALHEPHWTYVGLGLIVCGGAASRSALIGTPARTSDAVGRARAYSILMQMVNVGCFVGKGLARPIRVSLGLPWLDAFAAAMALVGLAYTLHAFREDPASPRTREPLRLAPLVRAVARVGRDRSFVGLMFLVGTFWAVQLQLYGTLPRYLVRLAGESASPEWCANVNPIVVMLLIVPVTRLSRSLAPRTAIGLAIALVAVSSFVMGLGPALSTLTGPAVALPLGITAHPYSLVLVAGAAISGVAECFLLPRWYEHVSGLAPPGQTAMYVGWSALNGLWANVLGYGLSGWLVEHWCPDPATLPAPAAEALARFVAGTGPLPGEYARAHAIWFVFAGIAVAAAAAAWVHARIMVRGAPPATR